MAEWLKDNGITVLAMIIGAIVVTSLAQCLKEVNLATIESRTRVQTYKAEEGHKFKFGITREPQP